ncbi:phage tail protein [Lactococcus lactis subsp. lactis]|uniref:major tail protein n=1 Tax=Lactococcus lactis TaxID=1358 RepID=UPI00097C89E7|nr:major tail protein [Lactococcus lactis]MCT3128047.1 phage tail protein [Lactococcus lactis]MRK42972.1 phage tail protein [Lactococcus lactis subsp. lactis]ONK33081.1 phage tail protein [Lactococcus lactis subsp. lactis]WPD49789.1 phage tail protein [Lactococcus lactis]
MGQQEKNKVEFGLENVYFARATTDLLSGATTYEKPIRWPGAVELSLEASGDLIKFKADNIDYYISGNNQGYDGKLTTALVPEEFATKILGEVVEGGVQTEYSNVETSPFALMFQFEGDKKATRHVLYNCSASRPSVGSSTIDKGDPNTTELSFSASPRPSDKAVKTKTRPDTEPTVYDAWFNSVYDKNSKTTTTTTTTTTTRHD